MNVPLALLFAQTLLVSLAWPQASTSTVRGTVRDQSKAAIAGASVMLTNTATNVAPKSATNEVGFYLFPAVLPGSYRLVIEAPGMEKFEGALTVQVQQDAVVDVILAVGQTATQVSVKDVTPMLTSDNPTLGHVLEQQRIEQLPINGRYVTALLSTIPGMEGVRAYGEEAGTLEWVQDGAVFTSRFEDSVARPPGLDTIQEFKVENNSSSAKFARPTTVVMSTKSGTNQIHGTAFETARNNGVGVARARTDFYTKPPHLVRNEFGASVGGPVILPKLYNGRNRTFWFFAWEDARNMSATTQAFSLPTEAMRNGDFRGLADVQGRQSKIYDPLTTNPATWARQQFSYQGQLNVIDPARLNPIAKYLYSITPLPTLSQVNPLVDTNWFGPVPTPLTQRTMTARIDHHFSDRDQLYARYTKSDSYRKVPTPGDPPMLNGVVGNYSSIGPNQSLALSEVHIFSPTAFNELLVSASRGLRGVNTDRNTKWLDVLGLPNPFDATGWPNISSNGLSYVYKDGGRQGSASNYFIVDDGFTKVRGRHQLQFGVHLRNDQLNVMPDMGGLVGSFDFGTLATALYNPSSSRTNPLATAQTGNNLANMYLGVMNYAPRLTRGYYYVRSREYALYFQDNYKATSRLTLNLGLRWEMRPASFEKNGVMIGYDKQRRAVVLGTSLDTMYRLGATLPSIVNRLEATGVKFESYQQAGLPQSLMYGNWKDAGPRAGFAYLAGEGKRSFVIRGGYSNSYFPILIRTWTNIMRSTAPFTATFPYQLNNAAQSPDGISNYLLRSVPTVYAGVNSRNIIDVSNASSITRGSSQLIYFDPHQPDARVQNWNMTLEKQVMSNTVARIAYVGGHSSHLEQEYTFNDIPPAYVYFMTTGQKAPTGEFANVAERPWDQQAIGTYGEYMKTGWANYNGMQFELERRYHRGFGFQVSYNINNNMAAGGNGALIPNTIPTPDQFLPGAVPADFNQLNRFVNYYRDTSIPKHRVNWNWIADLPFGNGKLVGRNAGGVLNKFIGGWQVAGTGSLRSTYFALPTGIYPTGEKIQTYGYKYPIQDCRGGTCWPGYLWWNGYIPANQINTHAASGQCTGVCGVPANYTPAGQPLNPWPQNPNPTDPMYPYYGTNTVWIPLKDGTVQQTTYDPGMHPWQNQFFPGPRQWSLDASLFKTIAIREGLRIRFNADFFNILNHPGNPNSVGGAGILDTRASGNPARQLQLTLRLTW